MATVVVTPTAVEDLQRLIRTLSLPANTTERVRASLEALSTFPQLGAPLSGRWEDFRFVLGPWRWMLLVYGYDLATDRVAIVTIQDARSAESAKPSGRPVAVTRFLLRAIEPSDGPAIDTLMRTEAQTTSMSITTHYHVDMYPALVAQHPSLFGVVATAPGTDGLVGVATAFTDQVRIGGRTYPSAHLENLKVRHEFRRQGLGRRLAEWRIEEADRRFGGEGVIATGIEVSNAASLATARSWSTQVLGPVRVVIATTRTKPPPSGGVSIRPLEDRDVEAVVEGVNAFHGSFDLYPPQTATSLAAQHAPTPLGEPSASTASPSTPEAPSSRARRSTSGSSSWPTTSSRSRGRSSC